MSDTDAGLATELSHLYRIKPERSRHRACGSHSAKGHPGTRLAKRTEQRRFPNSLYCPSLLEQTTGVIFWTVT